MGAHGMLLIPLGNSGFSFGEGVLFLACLPSKIYSQIIIT